MLTDWRATSLPELLAAHGLGDLPERPFPNDGWSGATLTTIERGGRRFVLKRTSLETDWIARATGDHPLREAVIAAGTPAFSGPVSAPYLGAGADGDAAAMLMPDLSTELIAWERPPDGPAIEAGVLDRVLDALAALHVEPWPLGAPGETFPWCPLPERLLLLTRPAAERYGGQGLAVGERFLAGWDAFDRCAPAAARDLVEHLAAQVEPLLAALRQLPSVALHGDLKLANVALMPGGRVGLIDWQMASLAPVAVELGWLLVSNVALLPEPPDQTLERYRGFARQRAARTHGGADAVLGDWEAQVDLSWIVGLLLRGWRKGLDAEAGIATGWGPSGDDDLAWWCRRAVEAAERRL